MTFLLFQGIIQEKETNIIREKIMQYEVEVTKRAIRQLGRIPLKQRRRIFAAIHTLEDSETWGDVKKLVNHEYGWRLRVGRYRVLFDATDDDTLEIQVITVEEVRKRDEQTY